jgi:hypothetical protein
VRVSVCPAVQPAAGKTAFAVRSAEDSTRVSVSVLVTNAYVKTSVSVTNPEHWTVHALEHDGAVELMVVELPL